MRKCDGGDFAENGKQDPVQVFDSFARDFFVELASQDELSLNYTLADPAGLWDYESRFRFFFLFRRGNGEGQGTGQRDSECAEGYKKRMS